MAGKTFPGTKVAYSLLGPAPGTPYTPLYRAAGQKGPNLASVNAGNAAMFIGGGGINATFSQIIETACPAVAGYPGGLWNYSTTVQPAAIATAQGGQPVTVLGDPTMPIRLIDVVLPATPPQPNAEATTEAALLDVFTAAACPHGNPANHAMLYLVPPDGGNTAAYPDAAAFLASVSRTARNAVAVMADYNAHQVKAHAALKLQPIPVMRMCLISGSIFKPPSVPVADVANAVFQGISRGLAAAGTSSGITLVEFENGGGGFDAIP
jgi:hypothetical protein